MPYVLDFIIFMITLGFVFFVGPIMIGTLVVIIWPYYKCSNNIYSNFKRTRSERFKLSITILCYPLIMSFALLVAMVVLALYYAVVPLFVIIFACRFIYYKCLKSRSVKNKKYLEKLIQ